jgi:Bacterial SH3 domain
MKAFLLFLILGGAALYTFLVVTHDALQDGKAETTLAVQTQPNQPAAKQVSSWGTYLSQKPEAPLAQQTAALPPQPSPSQDLERLPGADHQLAASEDEAATAQSDGADQEPVELAKVMLAAQMHSQASVSSPTVRFYRPGTEVQIVRREGIWLEVSDPVTQERGWVLAQYLSSIDSPIPAQVATESTTEPLTVAPSSKSNKRHRAAKRAVRDRVVVANADPWDGRWSRRADRRRGAGLFMFHPFGRWAQGR